MFISAAKPIDILAESSHLEEKQRMLAEKALSRFEGIEQLYGLWDIFVSKIIQVCIQDQWRTAAEFIAVGSVWNWTSNELSEKFLFSEANSNFKTGTSADFQVLSVKLHFTSFEKKKKTYPLFWSTWKLKFLGTILLHGKYYILSLF